MTTAIRLPCLSAVAEVEARHGVVWVSFADEGWPTGSPQARPWVSRAAGRDTPAELRALADAVEAALDGRRRGVT